MEGEKKIHYLQLLKQALGITLGNRFLGWFGFLIVLSGIFGNVFNFISREENGQQASQLQGVFHNKEVLLIAGIFGLLFWVLLMVVGIVGRGALIKSINELLEGRATTFKTGLHHGRKYWWRIFLIGLLFGIVCVALCMILVIPIAFLFINHAIISGIILSVLGVAIFLPIIFVAALIRVYGIIYVVTADLSIKDALENAYEITRKNILPSIIFLLLLIGTSFVVLIGTLMVALPLALVFFIFGGALYLILHQIGLAIAAIFGGVVVLTIFVAVSSMYQVFSQAFLVLFFRQIAAVKKEEVSLEIEKESIAAPVANIV